MQLNAIDLLSWLYSALVVQASGGPDLLADQPPELPNLLIESLLKLRTADGGFAKSPEGALGSTYQSFLVALIFEILGRAIPRRNQLVQFLYDRQRDDGGFVEIAPMRRSGTNPTAAAVALLSMLDALDADIRSAPDEPDGYNEYAWLVANTTGDFTKALRYARRALDAAADPDNASYLDTLAHCRAAVGDLTGAVRTQWLAHRREPHNRTIRRNLDRFRALQAAP